MVQMKNNMQILKEDNCFVIRKGKDKVKLTMSEVEIIWHRMNNLIRENKVGGSKKFKDNRKA